MEKIKDYFRAWDFSRYVRMGMEDYLEVMEKYAKGDYDDEIASR